MVPHLHITSEGPTPTCPLSLCLPSQSKDMVQSNSVVVNGVPQQSLYPT